MARRCVVFFGLVLGLFGLAASASAAPSGDGEGHISNVQTQPGIVQFLFSVAKLPDGAILDPESIVVTADGTTLSASAGAGNESVNPDVKATAPLRETMLVLDVSGSMSGDGIVAARSAAVRYARSLPSDVRVGLVTFSNKTTLRLKPTTRRELLVDAVGKVKAAGSTALYDGVLTAAAAMQGLPKNAERRMLILSDGDDTSSTHSLADVTHLLSNDKIPADVVAFRLPGSQAALKDIASQSHGRVLPAANTADLARVFTQAAAEFAQQILVTAKVPESLSGQATTLTATANAGSSSISATASVTLPIAVADGGSTLKVSAPAGSASKLQLGLILAVAFVSFLIVAMIALFLPVMSHARAEKQARLAQMHRYRVLGAMGGPAPTAVFASQRPTQTAVTQRALSIVDRTVRARGQRERLVGELDRAGMRLRPEEWAVIQVATVVVTAALVLVMTGSFVGFIIGGVIGWLGVRVFIKTKISRRQAAFMTQLPDTLQLLASSLRTGFSLNQALGGVVREGTEPTASEFARALTEVRLGADLEEALEDVANRMKCDDLSWVVMAIRISREVGGNLAEVLGTTVQTMRQRAELRGQVRVLSAEGRISARILTALPFFVAGALALVRPGYLKPLVTQPPGIAMLAVGITLLVLGTFWLSRIVKIKV
jgi:Flp pilus assembly protein TadB/Mg-chelatase subunit ChlD